MKTSLIVAAADNEVIGHGGALPWHLPADLKRFKALTDGHVVLAGRRTHESIVARLGKPLPGRFTVVATRAPDLAGNRHVVYEPTIDAALAVARGIEAFAGGAEVFVIGGAQIYDQTLQSVDTVYLTRVHSTPDGDTVMPTGWLDGFTLTENDPGPEYSFLTYRRG